MKKKIITIIDYGMGNLISIENAIKYLNHECIITSDNKKIEKSNILILPGVGSFYQAMIKLNKLGISKSIKNVLKKKQTKMLGICLGMQLMAKVGYEDKKINGLGLIDAEVKKFNSNKKIKIPHVGFNKVTTNHYKGLYKNLEKLNYFYFTHSYKMSLINERNSYHYGYCDYGSKFLASFENGKIFGTQYHPEKSQDNGLKMLKNFINL